MKRSPENAVLAVKLDAGKPRMDLIPPEILRAMGTVFAYGAGKYSDRNWEAGLSYGRLFASLQRHLWQWWGGEELDAESGLPTLAHAACCLAMLHATVTRGVGIDDRRSA